MDGERHPLYFGYLLFDLSTAFSSESVVIFVLWIIEALILFWRAKLEENLLLNTIPEYKDYCRSVPYRLVPMLL